MKKISKVYKELVKREGFEVRKEQQTMSELIKEGIDRQSPVLIEAETGSGKTLAYLIPTILEAIDTGKNIVISTNTINLQDQIIQKELPLIEEILGIKLNYTLIKGRNNYVCRRKLEEYKLKNDNSETSKIVSAIEKSKNGDKAELKINISNEIWEQIKSDKDTTLAKSCPYYKTCYYYSAKNRADSSQIFIVNHHILMLDILTDNSLIPKYDICVIDEAHNLELIIRRYFSKIFSFKNTFKNIGQLHNRNAKSIAASGHMYNLLDKLSLIDSKLDLAKMNEIYLYSIDEIYENLVKIMNKIFAKYKEYKPSGEIIEKITNVDKEKNKISDLLNDLEKNVDILTKLSEEYSLTDEKEYILVNNYITAMFTEIKTLLEILDFDEENYLHWIRYDNKEDTIPELNATPYYVAKKFKEAYVEKKKKIIFVSATLTVDKSFNYMKKSLGLEECLETIIPSSFNYKENMNLIIATDFNIANEDDFRAQIAEFTYRYAVKNKGKTFVLLTSYKDLNYIYNYLMTQKNDLCILRQGLYDRNELINRFKNEKNALLLGTDSFWEGVDVKGKALDTVIIPKLPFQVPDIPLVISITEKMKVPFKEYSLPQAIIRLKQGVGRLIRDKEDRGNVIILDNRIITKNYGRTILKSLPDGNLLTITRNEILEKYIKEEEC